MRVQTTQIQLKVSLSEQLNDLLQSKAARLGVPATQFVKHLIIKEVEDEQHPVFAASEWTENKTEKALKEVKKAVEIDDIRGFFKNL